MRRSRTRSPAAARCRADRPPPVMVLPLKVLLVIVRRAGLLTFVEPFRKRPAPACWEWFPVIVELVIVEVPLNRKRPPPWSLVLVLLMIVLLVAIRLTAKIP